MLAATRDTRLLFERPSSYGARADSEKPEHELCRAGTGVAVQLVLVLALAPARLLALTSRKDAVDVAFNGSRVGNAAVPDASRVRYHVGDTNNN